MTGPVRMDGVNLRLGVWFEWLTPLLPIVEEKIGIHVEQEISPYSGFFQKTMTALVGGVAPDLIMIDANENGRFFKSGLLLPYDDWLAASNIDMSKWASDPRVENGYKGKTYALSVFVMHDAYIVINKALAEKDGMLDGAPLWGTPEFDAWDWDDLVEWLKAGTKVQSNGTVEQYGFGAPSAGGTGRWLSIPRVYQLGGTKYDDDWSYEETESNVNSPAWVEAIQSIVDLHLKHEVNPSPDAQNAIQGGSFLARKALCAPTWSAPAIWPEEDTFEQQWIHYPWKNQRVHAFGANHITVNEATQQRDGAFHLVTSFTTDRDVAKEQLVSVVPPYDPLPLVGSMVEGRAKTIHHISLSRITGMSTVPMVAENTHVYPRFWGGKAGAFTGDTLNTAVDELFLGKKTAQQALNDAKEKIDSELAKHS